MERELRVTMPGIANRVRKASTARAAPTRGFLPSTVGQTSDYMSGSLAASAGGVMRPEMPSSAFKQRRVEMAEEEKGSVALRTVTYPIFAASTEATYTSDDGSSFVVSTQDAPMHIPGSATNLTASLVNASVPYVWDNLKEDQTVQVDGQFPRRVTLSGDKEIRYTLSQPSSTTQITSGTVIAPSGAETTNYLQDAEEQPFWFRPALEDAFVNMDDARFKTNGTSGWRDLTTASGGIIRSRVQDSGLGENPSTKVDIAYTGTSISVGDRVFQDRGANGICLGHVVSVTASTVFVRTLIGSAQFTNASSSKPITFTDPLDTSSVVSLTTGSVSNQVLGNAQSPQLTGEELTGSPMVKFDQKPINLSTVETLQTSGEIVLPDSALNALKSLHSDHVYPRSLSQGTELHTNGIITIPIRFNQATLDKMNEILIQFNNNKYNGISGVVDASSDLTYIKDVSRTVIRLCSFDFHTTSASDGDRVEQSINIFLACEPRSDASNRIWRFGVEMSKKEDQQLVFRNAKLGTANNKSFGLIQMRIDQSGNYSTTGGLGMTMGSPVELGSSTNTNIASLQSLCFLQISGSVAENSSGRLCTSDINIRLTDERAFDQDNVGTNGGNGISIRHQFDRVSLPDFINGKDNANFWNIYDVKNFRIGSEHHSFIDGDAFSTSGGNFQCFSAATPTAVGGGNFNPEVTYRTGGGLIWGDTPGLGFLVGDVFAVDNARLGRAGVSNMSEERTATLTHREIMNEILRRYKDPLKQQFDPGNASPFVALPSLDATTTSDYTSIVTSTRSFKLPPGNYNSVEAYITAVNAALSEDTASQCGLADLISLDIDHEGMDVEGDGDRNYKLEVHYNRPISSDNPLLTASTVGSGAEPLLNQRVNINMGNLDTAFPVYTKVREKGDHILLFAEGLTAGTSPLDILLVHKPSLTVTPIEIDRATIVTTENPDHYRVADVDLFVGKGRSDLSAPSYTGIIGLALYGQTGQSQKMKTFVANANSPVVSYSAARTVADPAASTAIGFTGNELTGRVIVIDDESSTPSSSSNNGAIITSFMDPNNSNNVENNMIRFKVRNIDVVLGDVRPSITNIAFQTSSILNSDFVVVDATFVYKDNQSSDHFVALSRRVSGSGANYDISVRRVTTDGTFDPNAANGTALSVNANVTNALQNGIVTGTDVGVDANGYITDYAKAARLAKMTRKSELNTPTGFEDVLLGISIPSSSSADNVAALVKRGDGLVGEFDLKYAALGLDSVVSHDEINGQNDGFCVTVLFSQSPAPALEDQINLVKSDGHVHVYKYTNAGGIIDGTTNGKPTSVTDLWYEFANTPVSQVGITDAVSSVVHSANTPSSTEQHMFTVGELTSYEDGNTSQTLAAPNFLHRTSMNKAGNADIIRYFEDKKLPTKVVFNPQQVMTAVWSDSEDNFVTPADGGTAYDDFEQDLINDADHNSKKYDMFDPRTAANQAANERGDPLVTKLISASLTIPKGNYTFTSLGRAINELLHELDDTKFGIATIVFEDNARLRKLYASARLSNSFTDDLPSQIKLSWSSGPFANLFTESQILLQASGPDPRVYTEDVSYVTTGLQAVRTVYLRCNFVQGGINPQRQKSQILASIPVDKEPGQTLVALPSVQLKVAAQNYLNQGDANTDLEFRITDEAGNPLAIGRDYSWSVNVLIEWEQDINLARLRQSDSETRHR